MVDDAPALFQWHLELALDAGDRAALEDVVGDNAGGGELAHEQSEGVGVVVDAFEQHGLIVDDDAAVEEGVQCSFGFGCDLVGMVKLGHDVELFLLVVFFKQSQQFGIVVDALGEGDWQTAAKADKIQMVDGDEVF